MASKKDKMEGYMVKVTDEETISLIQNGVFNSVGDWLNSAELTRERDKATYEYAGLPQGHLKPQGVSEIVSTDTTEVVEAYTAILSELLISNNRIARFAPYDGSPMAFTAAKQASDIVNYCIFKKNPGWEIMECWMKAALLWKNSILRWDYVEDYDYVFEEYEEVTEERLDDLLSDENVEIVGELVQQPVSGGVVKYMDVRLRRTIDKSTVKLTLVPPENFRISRDAKTMDDATFVATQTELTRSEIRKNWPEVAAEITDWDSLNNADWNTRYSVEEATRKQVTGVEYYQGQIAHEVLPVEATRTMTVTESWFRVDRDGDGIAELKHFITAGDHILYEADVDMVPMAMLCPFDIPFEFFGLSMADMTRSSTLASTAILRGFVENTYLTNYSPTLADPNSVDFSALQNMKPKQLIATNGNPAAAVQKLPPETISTGTVPLLEFLQLHKEQATGMSKAAQGLQDELFVSGNSEIKLQQVMSASQKRIQHIARRFTETGIKRLIKGVYRTMKSQMQKMDYKTPEGVYAKVDLKSLPNDMEVEILLDIGENSNQSRVQKLQALGQQVLPALKEMGADMVVKPDAGAIIATNVIDALGLNPGDYLEDYTTDEFRQKAAEAMQAEAQRAQEVAEVEKRKMEADAMLAEANVALVTSQANNALQDNIRQTAIAIDKHYQEWDKAVREAKEKGITPPQMPDMAAIMDTAMSVVKGIEQEIGVREPVPVQQQMAQATQGLPPGSQEPTQ